MKIAKKVLAVAIAVAMIACCAAMAFAADAKVTLKATEIVDGKFDVAVVANNYADLAAADWVVTYDAAAIKCVKADNNGTGNFANIATDPVLMAAASGQLMTAYNNENAGEVKVAFAFQTNLNNAGEVVLFTLNFEVVDADAKNVEIVLSGKDEAKLVINEEAVTEPTTEPTTAEPTTAEPTTAEPTTAEPTTAEPTTAEPTTEEAPSTPDEETTAKGETDNGPATGDTGVLAIAAGVVALAGAAFVVSKKRK